MTVSLLIVMIVWVATFLIDHKAGYPQTQPYVRWVCVGLFAVGFAVQCLYELGVPVPSLSQALSGFVVGSK